jgi:hypothetical protein
MYESCREWEDGTLVCEGVYTDMMSAAWRCYVMGVFYGVARVWGRRCHEWEG